MGTRYHSRVLVDHLETKYHKESAKAYRISSIEVDEVAPMEIAISKANKSQIDRIGKLMIQVYLDAKRLNLSAHSWPSRYIAGEASNSYDSLNKRESIISDGVNLQYVNPHGHLNLMSTIVNAHRDEFLRKINECFAISLRIDGSVDFTHIDKIYVMAKLINPDGSSELVFMGVSEQTERYATGLMLAVMEALRAAVDDPNLILGKISSVCTDGTNVNTGDKKSLWVLIDEAVKSSGSKIPILKIWCAAHRAELAWKSASSAVPEVNKALTVLSRMSSYFHCSGIRSAELKNIAAEHNLRLHNLPKIFEIRWSEFTFTLIRSVLVSWKALVLYFQKNKEDADCAGFLNYLTKLENLELIALLADVLFAFKRFQKKLQTDQLTLISLKSSIDAIKKTLNGMGNVKLPGGFESNLATKLKNGEDDKIYLKNIELQPPNSSRTRREGRKFALVRKSLLPRCTSEFFE